MRDAIRFMGNLKAGMQREFSNVHVSIEPSPQFMTDGFALRVTAVTSAGTPIGLDALVSLTQYETSVDKEGFLLSKAAALKQYYQQSVPSSWKLI